MGKCTWNTPQCLSLGKNSGMCHAIYWYYHNSRQKSGILRNTIQAPVVGWCNPTQQTDPARLEVLALSQWAVCGYILIAGSVSLNLLRPVPDTEKTFSKACWSDQTDESFHSSWAPHGALRSFRWTRHDQTEARSIFPSLASPCSSRRSWASRAFVNECSLLSLRLHYTRSLLSSMPDTSCSGNICLSSPRSSFLAWESESAFFFFFLFLPGHIDSRLRLNHHSLPISSLCHLPHHSALSTS